MRNDEDRSPCVMGDTFSMSEMMGSVPPEAEPGEPGEELTERLLKRAEYELEVRERNAARTAAAISVMGALMGVAVAVTGAVGGVIGLALFPAVAIAIGALGGMLSAMTAVAARWLRPDIDNKIPPHLPTNLLMLRERLLAERRQALARFDEFVQVPERL